MNGSAICHLYTFSSLWSEVWKWYIQELDTLSVLLIQVSCDDRHTYLAASIFSHNSKSLLSPTFQQYLLISFTFQLIIHNPNVYVKYFKVQLKPGKQPRSFNCKTGWLLNQASLLFYLTLQSHCCLSCRNNSLLCKCNACVSPFCNDPRASFSCCAHVTCYAGDDLARGLVIYS